MRHALLVLLALTAIPALPAATLDLDVPRLPALPDPALPEAAAPDLADVAPLSVDAGLPAPERPSPFEGALGAVPPAAPAVAAGVGGLALVGAMGGLRWLAVAGVALYSRLTKSDMLDNGHRDRVYRLVQEAPGLTLSEAAERAGVGWGTAVYHLDRLERAGFIASERSGLRRCYFPVGTLPRDDRAGLGTLKAETTRTIAEFLVRRPGATQGELADALGLSASAASKQVTKLESAGLVRREREWKTVRLHPEPRLGALLGSTGTGGGHKAVA